jgi:prepilin-type N-terminal cleavage/methylation domain-containing protein
MDVKRWRSEDGSPAPAGFTLVELLVVITVITILMALLFPVFRGAQEQAKRTQAKNDVIQIVTAVNAFYTEYGQYPCAAQSGEDKDDYQTDQDADRVDFMTTLRAPIPSMPPALNPKGIIYLQPPPVKDDTVGNRRSGVGSDGIWHDPWGNSYQVRLDNNYNGTLRNPYLRNAGSATLNAGAVAWSFGTDGASDSIPGPAPDRKAGTNRDDVISWQ